MPRIKKAIAAALFICSMTATFFGMAPGAAAAETVNLPAGILIGDQDGVQVDEHGEYYIDARGLKPGDVIHKVLTIQNLEQNDKSPEGKAPYTLTMTAEPLLSAGPVDLLEKVHLTLKLDGKIIYEGPSRGNGTPNMIEKALNLGAYKLGERRILDVTLKVDPALQLFEKKSEADFKWHFYAYRVKEDDPPKTGILEDYGALFPIGGVLLLVALLLPLKKRRGERTLAQTGKNQ
jgi:hypothetical protein